VLEDQLLPSDHFLMLLFCSVAPQHYFGYELGVTYYNLVSDQYTGLNGIVVPGTPATVSACYPLTEYFPFRAPTPISGFFAAYSGSLEVVPDGCGSQDKCRLQLNRRPEMGSSPSESTI
jgi:hypothetical protein